MTTIANSSMTLGALFGAITTAASTISSTLNAVNDGVGMLNKTVRDAAERQALTSETDMVEFDLKYKLEAAQRIQEFNDGIDDWISARPNRAEKFKNTLADLETAIEARRNRKPT